MWRCRCSFAWFMFLLVFILISFNIVGLVLLPSRFSVTWLLYPLYWCVGLRVVCSKRAGIWRHLDPAASGLSFATYSHAIGIEPLQLDLVKSFVRSISYTPNQKEVDWLGSRSTGFVRAWALAWFWFLVRHQSACLRLLGLESCVELCWSSANGIRSFVLARLALNLQPLFLCPINSFCAVAL